MKCQNCGTELPAQATFCYSCGLPVQNDDKAQKPQDKANSAASHTPGQEVREPGEPGESSKPSKPGEPSKQNARAKSAQNPAPDAPTNELPVDPTAKTSLETTAQTQRAHTNVTPKDSSQTQLARRRQKTVVSGETTPLVGGALGALDGANDAPPSSDGEPEAPPQGPPSEEALQEEPQEPQEPLPEARARRVATYGFLVIAAVVVVAVVTAFVTWRLELWGGATVPDVMGLSEQEATAQLESAGFEVAVEPVVVDSGVGTVVSMQPQAGRRIAVGRVISIGMGVDRTVPSIEGLELSQAREALAQNGIDRLRLEYQNSSKPKGTVISASPVAGSKVSAEDVVTIVVAQPFTVPDVVGLTVEAAQAALERAGLAMDLRYVPSEQVQAGRVVETDPTAGTELSQNAQVLVWVSSPYPQNVFDLEGYLTSSPGDISTFLTEQGYAIGYAKNDNGSAQMTWEYTAPASSSSKSQPQNESQSEPQSQPGAESEEGEAAQALHPPKVGLSAMPFSLPQGFQFWHQDVLLEGAKIQGVYLPLGAADLNDLALELTVSQDCVTQLMNLCGLRSTANTTTTATQESVTPALGSNVTFVAKAGSMDGYTWYVVVWEDTGSQEGINAALGLAPSDSLNATLKAQGYDLSKYGDSMANLAASLVIEQPQNITLWPTTG